MIHKLLLNLSFDSFPCSRVEDKFSSEYENGLLSVEKSRLRSLKFARLGAYL